MLPFVVLCLDYSVPISIVTFLFEQQRKELVQSHKLPPQAKRHKCINVFCVTLKIV